MMSLLTMALLLGAGDLSQQQSPSSTDMDKGLLGWGLAVEAPMVGVLGGVAERSRVGVVDTLGFGLNYELTPTWHLRAYISGANTLDAEAPVSFLEGGERIKRRQAAEWESFESAVGVAYMWDNGRLWRPYVGGDIGMVFHGYDYRFSEELKKLEGLDVDNAQTCRGISCRSDIHDGFKVAFTAGVRGGIRLRMARWLATQAEAMFAYARVANTRLTNTLEVRDVRAVEEHMLSMRFTFSVLFLL
jgi:hypothetical protein